MASDAVSRALNDAGAVLGAFLVWLRGTPTLGFPTVAHGELLYSPLIVVALLFRLGAVLDMVALLRRLKREGKDQELGASARERLQRSQRGMLRLGIWAVICWSLLTNYEYTVVVFTVGVLAYGAVEVLDGALGWKYQNDRRRYWQQRDERDDFAERVAAQAGAAAERAEASAATAVVQGQRIEAALAENTELTKEAGRASAEAERVANHVNSKIASLGEGLTEGRRQDRDDVEHIKQTTDDIKAVADDTHALVKNGAGDGPKEDPP